ncbi:mannose-6-phosphate isomerase, partial [Streptomyces albidoflavus]
VRDLTLPTPQILLGTEGSPTVGELPLGPGQSVFVPAGEPVELRGPGTVFRATALT